MSDDTADFARAIIELNETIQQKADQVAALVAILTSLVAVLQVNGTLSEQQIRVMFQIVDRISAKSNTPPVADLLAVVRSGIPAIVGELQVSGS